MALAQRALGAAAPASSSCSASISGALFYGDAIITPALSVLSAVEGLKVVTPAFDPYVVPLTVVILIALFAVQSRGTARSRPSSVRSRWSGSSPSRSPGSGTSAQNPSVLCAFNPLVRRELPAQPRHDRPGHARRRVPRGHRRGSALCRSRPFRPRPDPDRLAARRAARACAQLSRPGRAGARRSESDRESRSSCSIPIGRCCRWSCWRPPRP